MLSELCLILTCALWLVKSYNNCSNLPQLYYRLANRRNVSVKEFRELEKDALRVSKLTLDVAYFDKCLELEICPKYLRFKVPNLKAFKDPQKLYIQGVKCQLESVKDDLRKAKRKYKHSWDKIYINLSFMERHVLLKTLNVHIGKFSNEITERHNRKLLALRKTERTRST